MKNIGELIAMFEDEYNKGNGFINLRTNGDADKRQIIESNPDIFYMASKSRAVLVRWICEIIREMFAPYGNNSDINIATEAYDEIREKLSTKALNRETLCSLFGCQKNSSIISYEDFIEYEKKYISEYNKYAFEKKVIEVEMPKKVIDIYSELDNILHNKREAEVLKQRSQGITLDVIGSALNVTRERARQIEIKPRQRLRRWLEHRADKLVEKLCENNLIIESKAITMLGESKWKIIKYVVSAESGDYKWNYIKDIDAVIFDNASKFNAIAEETLKHIRKSNAVSDFVEKMNQAGYLFVNSDIAKKYLNNKNFNTFGETVVEGKMTIGKATIATVNKYFPEGITLSDEKELKKFADILNEQYSLNVKPNRALTTRMQGVLVMCGKAKYCTKEKLTISEELLLKISNYINNEVEQDRILYRILFDKFEKELKAEGINNYHALHGILKENEYKCKIICIKHYVCKNITKNVLSENYFKSFEQWLIEKNRPVAASEIFEKFKDWNLTTIKQAMGYYRNIVKWDDETYFNTKCLKITDTEVEKLSEILCQATNNKYHYISSYLLYSKIQKEAPEILRKYNITTEKQAYYVVQNIFADKYVFRRPHISADLSRTSFSTDDLVRMASGNKARINKLEMINVLAKYYGERNSSLSLAIQKHLSNYIRINGNEYFRKDKIKFNTADIAKINNFIKKNLIKETILLPAKITDFSELPEIACGWNSWVLCEMVDFLNLPYTKIEKKNAPSQNNMTIILSNNSNITNKDEALRWLMKNDYNESRDKSAYLYAKKTGMYHTNLTSEEVSHKLNV